jgi:hypothetical protein
MPILTIREWYGRLGNNIIQLANAMRIALYYKIFNIETSLRDFFNYTIITINDGVEFNSDRMFSFSNFFYQEDTTYKVQI